METQTFDFINMNITDKYLYYSNKLGSFLTVARFFYLNSDSKTYIESLVNIIDENNINVEDLNLSESEYKAFAKLNNSCADEEERKALLNAISFVVDNKLLQPGTLSYKDTTNVNFHNGYEYFENVLFSEEPINIIKRMSVREHFMCQLHVATIAGIINLYKPESLDLQAVPLLKNYLDASYKNRSTKICEKSEELFLFYGKEKHFNDSNSVFLYLYDSGSLYFKNFSEEPEKNESDFTLDDLLKLPQKRVKDMKIYLKLQNVSCNSFKSFMESIFENQKFIKVSLYGTFLDQRGNVAEIPTINFSTVV